MLDCVPERLTVLAVIVPGLQSELSMPAWITIAIVCACAWGLVAAEFRRHQQPKADPRDSSRVN
jgi:hypothetical protein